MAAAPRARRFAVHWLAGCVIASGATIDAIHGAAVAAPPVGKTLVGQATQGESAQSDPTKRDPTKRDPTKRDPTKRDPTKRDPTKRDSAQDEPVRDATVDTETGGVDPIPGWPVLQFHRPSTPSARPRLRIPLRPPPEATRIADATASAATSAFESLRSQLVGRTVPPYPAGLRSNTGSCIGATDEEGDVCGRSIATLDDDLGVSRHLFAGAAMEPVNDMPQWRVTDVIVVPPMRSHEALQIGTCEADRKPDAALAALVDARGAGEMVTRVRWAVRLQRDSGRFVTVPAATVACINEGFGE